MNNPPCNIATIHKAYLSSMEADKLYNLLVSETDIQARDRLLLPDGGTGYTDTGKCMFVDEELTDFNNFIPPHGRRFIWPKWLLPLRDRIEDVLQMEFSVCVALFYPNGSHWIEYHTDYPAFGCTKILPSISMGATRNFSLKEKAEPHTVYDIPMEHGDLVIMREECQNLYEHALLKETDVTGARINLTFRPFNWKNLKRLSKVRY